MVGPAVLDDENNRDVVTYVIDISKQKENEKRRNELQRQIKKQQDEFYSIFKEAPALIVIRRGKDLTYEFVNEAFVNFEGPGKYIGKKMRPGSQFGTDALVNIKRKVMETGETYIANSYKLQHKDKNTGRLVDSGLI